MSGYSYTDGMQDTLLGQTNPSVDEVDDEEIQSMQFDEEQAANILEMTDDEFEASSAAAMQPKLQQQIEPEITDSTPEPEQFSDPNIGKPLVPEQEVDTKDFYNKLTSEFVADGKKIRITNPDEFIKLAQMGTNYNSKMHKLKPNLGIVKALEQHKLNDPEKVKFLIDLANHDKTAIAKLIKDSEIDMYDLPDLEETPYKSKAEVYNAEQIALLEQLEVLKASPNGNLLLKDLNSKWDDASLNQISDSPEALNSLYQDKESGLYDKVMDVIETDRMLGRIPASFAKEPTLTIYEFVATQILRIEQETLAAQQLQANQPKQQIPQQQYLPRSNAPLVIGSNVKNSSQPIRANINASKSAAITNSGYSNPIPQDIDFLSMSDAEFESFNRAMNLTKF